MPNSNLCVACGLTAALLAPSSIAAQTVAQSFDELQRTLKPGQMVVVTDASGHEIKGRVADLSISSLAISGRAARTFVAADVARIRRTDGLTNGILIGAGVGGGITALSILAAGSSDGIYLVLALGWIGPTAGAVAGAFVDRSQGNQPVYIAPPRESRVSVSVSPLLSTRRSGILVSLRF